MNLRNHNTAQTQLSLFAEPKQVVEELDTVHQYFFIISPPGQVKQKVKLLKHELNKKVGLSNYNLQSSPIISLMSFHTMRPVNDKFIEAVQSLFSKFKVFDIELNEYEHFDHGTDTNTIYVKLQDSEQVLKLYKELHLLLGLKIRSYTPHLTIAKTVARSKFDKCFSLVKKNNFHENFACQQVTILERKLQDGTVSNYQVLKEFKLAA